ncbi:MAG: hypothetical protein AAB213_04325 [Candidatus Omnitrophota bacterium]
MKERALSILKFILAVLFLPIVIGVTKSFFENLRAMDASVSFSFGWGVVAYLILHILLYEPTQVFDASQKMTERTIGFLSPWAKVAGFCVPFFTILSFIIYYFASLVWKEANLLPYFSFFASFTFAMHMVMTANSLKKKQPGWLKENYFFSIFIIYIVNMLIVAGAFALLSQEFSFLSFIKRCGEVASAIYTASFRQLFEVENR